MRKSRFRILRLLAMLAMIASVSGVFSLGASAAPASLDNNDRNAFQEAGTITVTVTNVDTGEPIPGAEVSITDSDGVVVDGGTATDGTFVSASLDPGAYTVSASAADYEGNALDVTVDGPVETTVPLAPVQDPEPVTGPITITVTDADTGLGIAGAEVLIEGESLTTDADGNATTAGVYEPGEYPFTASHVDYMENSGTATVTEDGVGYGEIALVADDTGEPVPGTITVEVIDFSTGDPIEGATATIDATSEILTTGPEGTATTEQLYEVGSYDFTASAPGFNTGGGTATVSVDGVGYGLAELSPEDPGPMGDIIGTVWDADTEDFLVGALICVEGGECVESNELGNWLPIEVPFGTYNVTASLDGYESQTLEVVVDETTDGIGQAHFRLVAEDTGEPVPGTITVTVVDEADAPIEGATVSNGDGSGVVEDGPTDTDGVYVSSELPAGTYTAGASAPGYEPNSVSVDVDGDVDATVTLIEAADLDDGTITTTVTDADTTDPIADATVTIWDGAGLQVDSGTTGDDGVYVSTELVGGTYAVTASADGYLDGGNEDVVVDGDVATDIALNPAGEEPEGTVTVFKYVCEELDSDEPVWGVEPGDDCAPGSATFVFSEVIDEGLGEGLSLDVDGEGSIDLPVGTYQVTENGFFSTTEIEVTEEGTTLSVLNPVVETSPVTIVADTSDDGSAEGALVYIEGDNGDNGDDIQTFQTPPADGSLDANNSFTTDLPAGNYTVTIDGTDQGYEVASATFAVPVDGDVVVTLQELVPTGTVNVQKVYCEDLDEVVFNPDDIDDDCAFGAASFSFYLVGDGSGDVDGQLDVWEDGRGSIELEAGTYVVVEEGTQAETEIVVTEGEETNLSVANPGTPPAPRDGTVNLSVFTCTNIDRAEWSSDAFFTTFALDTFDPACEPGTATLSFYLFGDGSGEPNAQVTVEGTDSVMLAPGTYEVVEETTGSSTLITVNPGDFHTLSVNIPAGGEVIPGASVNIVKFYCDTVTEVEFQAYGMEDVSDRDELPGAPECVSGSATFTFYLVGDGTDDYAQIVVNGSGSIGLEPGMYVVVEEGTQATFELEVLENDNTLLVVNNPIPDDGEIPGPVPPPDDGDDPDDPKDPDKDKDKDKDEDEDEVTELPSTGHGAGGSDSSLLMMAAAAASAIAGAGAFAIRRQRA